MSGNGFMAKMTDHFRKHKSQARDVVVKVRIEGGKLVPLELVSIQNTGEGTVIEFQKALV